MKCSFCNAEESEENILVSLTDFQSYLYKGKYICMDCSEKLYEEAERIAAEELRKDLRKERME